MGLLESSPQTNPVKFPKSIVNLWIGFPIIWFVFVSVSVAQNVWNAEQQETTTTLTTTATTTTATTTTATTTTATTTTWRSRSRPLSKQRPQWRFDNLNLIAHFFFCQVRQTAAAVVGPCLGLSLSFKLDSFQSLSFGRFWFPLLPLRLSSPIKHDDGDR